MTPVVFAEQAMLIARQGLWVLPCWILLCVAVPLLKGAGANQARISLTICATSIILGTHLVMIWLILTLKPSGIAETPTFAAESAPFSGVVLRSIIWTCSALAVHSFLYLLQGLKQLPVSLRNKAGTLCCLIGLASALFLAGRQIPFWSAVQTEVPQEQDNRELIEIRFAPHFEDGI
jgi:hypothetical protein